MAGAMGKARKSGEPSAAVARKIGILLDLVRNKRVSLHGCIVTYGAAERTILRDLQELREMGETAGFHISDRKDGDYFEMSEFRSPSPAIASGDKRVRALIAELFKAFGEPVHDLAGGFADRPTGAAATFIRLVQPQLMDGTTVAKVCSELEAAWRNDARVAFGYRGAQRRVEPAAAVVRSGRYYLLARDIDKARDGWRMFAMDVIELPIRRCGTFKPVDPPAKYVSGDSIGFFKGEGRESTVCVTLSKALAPSAVSRKWQEAQRVHRNDDGTLTIFFVVDDVDEVVRWALGFGDEAWISGPPDAVARAREVLQSVEKHYR